MEAETALKNHLRTSRHPCFVHVYKIARIGANKPILNREVKWKQNIRLNNTFSNCTFKIVTKAPVGMGGGVVSRENLSPSLVMDVKWPVLWILKPTKRQTNTTTQAFSINYVVFLITGVQCAKWADTVISRLSIQIINLYKMYFLVFTSIYISLMCSVNIFLLPKFTKMKRFPCTTSFFFTIGSRFWNLCIYVKCGIAKPWTNIIQHLVNINTLNM